MPSFMPVSVANNMSQRPPVRSLTKSASLALMRSDV